MTKKLITIIVLLCVLGAIAWGIRDMLSPSPARGTIPTSVIIN